MRKIRVHLAFESRLQMESQYLHRASEAGCRSYVLYSSTFWRHFCHGLKGQCRVVPSQSKPITLCSSCIISSHELCRPSVCYWRGYSEWGRTSTLQKCKPKMRLFKNGSRNLTVLYLPSADWRILLALFSSRRTDPTEKCGIQAGLIVEA